MPPESVMIFASFLSQSDRSRRTLLDVAPDSGALPKRPRLKRHRGPHALEGIREQLLRHEPDLGCARRGSRARCRGRRRAPCRRSACTMPQMMLMSVVLPAPFGPRQREDLAPPDVEVHVLQGDEAARVDLAQSLDGHDGGRFGRGCRNARLHVTLLGRWGRQCNCNALSFTAAGTTCRTGTAGPKVVLGVMPARVFNWGRGRPGGKYRCTT